MTHPRPISGRAAAQLARLEGTYTAPELRAALDATHRETFPSEAAFEAWKARRNGPPREVSEAMADYILTGQYDSPADTDHALAMKYAPITEHFFGDDSHASNTQTDSSSDSKHLRHAQGAGRLERRAADAPRRPERLAGGTRTPGRRILCRLAIALAAGVVMAAAGFWMTKMADKAYRQTLGIEAVER